MTKRRPMRTWILGCAALGCFATLAFAIHGRYLKDAATSSIVHEYGNAAPTQYDRPVTDDTKEIAAGEIRFDYDTYSKKGVCTAPPANVGKVCSANADCDSAPGNGTCVNAGNVSGGGAMAGGFFMAEGVKVKPGFELHWVQTVTASSTGTSAMNNWHLPAQNAGEYPDAPPGGKAYPHETTKIPLIPPATLGFQDFPNRGFRHCTAPAANVGNICVVNAHCDSVAGNGVCTVTGGADSETWLAELGLVCIADETGPNGREVRVISTLLWGFGIDIGHAPPFAVADVTAHPKKLWSAPTQSYLDTLNAFYSGAGGGGGPGGGPVASTEFDFIDSSNCFEIPPDPHATPELGSGSSVFDFGTGGTSPPIPADFFGPGSDPFEGTIQLRGKSIDPATTGDTSTLVQRSATPVLPTDAVGTQGTVNIEIVALSLVSIQPITVTYNGGQNPEQWDVEVGLSDVPAPIGTMTVTKTHANGGTFDTSLHVQPKLTFTYVLNPTQTNVLDTGLEGIAPINFSATGMPFVHAVDPSLRVFAPSDGTFVPGVDETVPGDPSSQVSVPGIEDDPGTPARHTITTATLCGNNVLDPSEQCDGADDAKCPGSCLPDCSCAAGSKIPTVSEWGLGVMLLMVLTAGTVVLGRRRYTAA